MSILLLFVDGVGVGEDDRRSNPFAAADVRALAPLCKRPAHDDTAFRALDATLGVAGLPQSATGQTTLFTGTNAARHAGGHLTGVPGPSLIPLLAERSLFVRLVREGCRPTFANAYTRAHLDAKRPRWSATTRMMLASGVTVRMIGEHDVRDRALYHDYTGAWLERRGIPAVRRDAAGAARVLGGLLADHDLVLYEYFLTDLAGHRGSWDERVEQARRVEALLVALRAVVDPARHTVLLVSDHGNLEEARHDRHTLNPVPLLGWGDGAGKLVRRIGRMEALTPVLADGVVEQKETERAANSPHKRSQPAP